MFVPWLNDDEFEFNQLGLGVRVKRVCHVSKRFQICANTSSPVRLSIARLTTFGDDFHVPSGKRFEVVQLRQQRR